jgi:hypothetical protein
MSPGASSLKLALGRSDGELAQDGHAQCVGRASGSLSRVRRRGTLAADARHRGAGAAGTRPSATANGTSPSPRTEARCCPGSPPGRRAPSTSASARQPATPSRASSAGADLEPRAAIALCVSEAVTSAIVHAYRDPRRAGSGRGGGSPTRRLPVLLRPRQSCGMKRRVASPGRPGLAADLTGRRRPRVPPRLGRRHRGRHALRSAEKRAARRRVDAAGAGGSSIARRARPRASVS